MNELKERMLPAVSGLALAVMFLVWSFAYEGRAHIVPMLIGWTAVALTVLDIFAQTNTRTGKAVRSLVSGQPLDAPVSEDAPAGRGSVRMAACLWPVVFVGLAAVLGFIAAIPVYTVAFMRLQGKFSWRRAIGAALIITAVTWIVFEQLLSYRVFEGLLFGGQL